MANWWQISDLLDRTFSLYTPGQSVGAGGGITSTPVLVTANVQASIQPLSGDEKLLYGKTLQDADTYVICLTALTLKNGDLIIDDKSINYRVVYFEDYDVVTGRYFALICKKLVV